MFSKTSLCFLFLSTLVCASLAELMEPEQPIEDLDALIQAELEAERDIAAVADRAIARMRGARGGRARRDDDAPFRKCGAQLLQHIINENLCRPDKCDGISKRSADAGSEVFSSRSRRSPDTKVITKLCCENVCRPSQIRAICCGKK